MKLKNIIIVALMTIAVLILFTINTYAQTVIVNTDELRLRTKPSTDEDSKTIQLLDNGQKLEYIDEEGKWYKVKINGTIGYVSKDFTKLEEEKTNTTVSQNQEQTKNEEGQQQVKEEVEGETQEQQIPAEMKTKNNSKIYILPLINSTIIEEIQKDSTLKIISKTNGWVYVETENTMGWIRYDLLVDTSVVSDDTINNADEQKDAKEESPKQTTLNDVEIAEKTMYVNNSSIYVRKGPGTNYEIIDSLILNDTVKVIAENGEWYKVQVLGKVGYIAKRLLSDRMTETTTRSENEREIINGGKAEQVGTSSASSKGQQVVDFAKQYLGCKYVYGASGPNTFDCSGFTMFVFRNFGVSLSHSATAQSKVGTHVDKANLQPGDLVFFTDYETGQGIGHVGIYIGNGDFIHASSGTGYCVKTSTLLSGSYLKRYETARRVI